jgi:hypothetical protein
MNSNMKENPLVSNNSDSYDKYDNNSYNDNMNLLDSDNDSNNRLFINKDDQFSNNILKYRSSLIIMALLSAAGLLGIFKYNII